MNVLFETVTSVFVGYSTNETNTEINVSVVASTVVCEAYNARRPEPNETYHGRVRANDEWQPHHCLTITDNNNNAHHYYGHLICIESS